MGFLLVMKAEVVKTWIMMRRYALQTVVSLVVGYGFLLLLIVGFMARRDEMTELVGNRFGVDPESATNAALGFIIGMFAFGVVGVFSQGLQGMARTGELEQLCLSPHGLVTNFMARSAVSSVLSIVMSSIMLVLIARTLQGTLHTDVGPTAVLLFLAYTNLLGFGFMVGGLVLVFKQIGQIAALVRAALLFLAFIVDDAIDTGSAPLDWLLHAMPITDAAICLKYVLIKNQMMERVTEAGETIQEHVSVFTLPSFYFLLVSCVVWTVIGILVFRYMENWSRDKGTLGAY